MRELGYQEEVLLLTAKWEQLAELRGQLLAELQEKAQRLEAALVMTEDQRDKGFAERDALISAAMDTVHKGIAAYNTAIAERDEARKQLDDLKRDYTDTSYWGKA